MEKTVLDSIDRPIRQLVIELNRIGLRTKFCCCGFPYRGEEEKKTHAKHAFVVLYDPLKDQDEQTGYRISAFFNLARRLPGTGFKLHQYHGNGEWYLNGEDLIKGENNFYRHEGDEIGLHDYESTMIAIQALTRRLRELPSISEEFKIEDGNAWYAERTDNEWQIDPKPSVILRKEEAEDVG